MNKLWKVLIAPRQVFDELKDTNSFVLPLLLLLATGAVCVATFAYVTPDETYVEHVLDQVEIQEELDVVPEETIGDLREDLLSSDGIAATRISATIVAPVLYVVGIVLGLLILATYYWVAGKSFETGLSWKSWFSFSCWAAMPLVVWSICTFVLLIIGGDGLIHGLAPLTWIGITPPWAVLLNIPLVWTVVISIQGIRSWGSKRSSTSTIIVLVPYVLYVLLGSFYLGIMAMMS